VSDAALWTVSDYKLLFGLAYIVVISLLPDTTIMMVLQLRTMLGCKPSTLFWQIILVDQMNLACKTEHVGI